MLGFVWFFMAGGHKVPAKISSPDMGTALICVGFAAGLTALLIFGGHA